MNDRTHIAAQIMASMVSRQHFSDFGVLATKAVLAADALLKVMQQDTNPNPIPTPATTRRRPGRPRKHVPGEQPQESH